jgi:hypothetical protein
MASIARIWLTTGTKFPAKTLPVRPSAGRVSRSMAAVACRSPQGRFRRRVWLLPEDLHWTTLLGPLSTFRSCRKVLGIVALCGGRYRREMGRTRGTNSLQYSWFSRLCRQLPKKAGLPIKRSARSRGDLLSRHTIAAFCDDIVFGNWFFA